MNKEMEVEIISKFKEIIKSYPKNRLKYIHWKSVRNFIYHLNNFPDNPDKSKIEIRLLEYIEIVDKSSVINTSQDSLNLFNAYLQPTGKLYEHYLDFHVVAKTSTILFGSLIIVVALYFLNANYLFYIGLIFIDFTIIYRHYYFAKQMKSYSLMY